MFEEREDDHAAMRMQRTTSKLADRGQRMEDSAICWPCEVLFLQKRSSRNRGVLVYLSFVGHVLVLMATSSTATVTARGRRTVATYFTLIQRRQT